MIDFDNQTDFTLDISSFEKILSKISNKDVEFILTNNSEIQNINKEYRNINKPTDVLSFPITDFPNAPLGTVIISFDIAKQIANKLGHTVEDEIKLLFIHGCLHLVGFDHEVDAGEHRAEEIRLLEYFDLPKSLIVRSDEGIAYES
jgi:probable rRNA maturation factor